MPRGRKRIYIGLLFAALTLFAVAGIIATRWHRVTMRRFDWPGPIVVQFSEGTCSWRRYHDIGYTVPPQPFFEIDYDRPAPFGPRFLFDAKPTRVSILTRPLPDHLKPVKFWRLGFYLTDAESTSIHHVLWPIPLATVFLAIFTLRSGLQAHRRSRAHHCHKCGYDLSATAPASPCPECGESPSSPRVASTRREVLEGQ